MGVAVLLVELVSLGLVSIGAFQAARLASLAPRNALRRAWLAMAGLLVLILALGTYTTADRVLSEAVSGTVMAGAIINLLGATIIFATIVLARLTADDVLRVSELELAAYTDKLTNLPNRRSFDSALSEQVEIAQRRDEPFALIMLDIDRFKRVNDENGHEWGDKVLAHLGRLLAAHKRKGDTAFRIGGEEFAILAPHSSTEQARAVAERLRQAIEGSPAGNDERRTSITVSFGVAMLRPDDTGSTLAHRADEALYCAKRNGRNRVCTEDEVALTCETPADA